MAEPTDASGAKDRENRAEYIFKKYVRWAIFFAATAFDSVFLLGAVETICYQDWVLKLAKEHFAAIVGLPFAALAYLCLVILLEITTGTIEVKGLGFEFKGAGGPLVMWVISFLSIATAIKMLW